MCKNGCIQESNMIELFNEYEQDNVNNVPKEDSVARTILILGNMSLVHHVIKHKLNIEYYDDNIDEISIGKLGLIKAVDTFKWDHNIKFSTYAVRVITNEILMYYKKINSVRNKSNKNAISLEECTNDEAEEQGQLYVLDFLGEDDEGLKEIVERDLIDRIMKVIPYLNAREQIVMAYSFGLYGHPRLKQHELADKMGVSRGYISGLYMRGLNKLKLFAQNEQDLSAEQLKQKQRIIKRQPKEFDKTYDASQLKWG